MHSFLFLICIFPPLLIHPCLDCVCFLKVLAKLRLLDVSISALYKPRPLRYDTEASWLVVVEEEGVEKVFVW